jgi:beta-glucosidase
MVARAPGEHRERPPSPSRAVLAAKESDVAIVVVGYDGGWEAEGADNAGAPVAMPWADEVAAIVQLWFPWMEGGNALADVLFGDVNPSGRLPTTFPRRLEDAPAYPFYPGQNGVVRYTEGLLVGYRNCDRSNITSRFCFGHGLSYTRFEYANLTRTVTVDRPSRAFAHWNPLAHSWTVRPGEREILIGSSSRHIRENAYVSLSSGGEPV